MRRQRYFCTNCDEFFIGRGINPWYGHVSRSWRTREIGSWCFQRHLVELSRKEFKNKEVPGGDRRAAGDRDDSGTGRGSDYLTRAVERAVARRARSGGITTTTNRYLVGNGGPELFVPKPTPPTLPEREDSMPFLAWKWAQLLRDEDGWWFGGIGVASKYRAKAVAECRHDNTALARYRQQLQILMRCGYDGNDAEEPASHAAPGVDCKCGFYGLASPPKDHGNYRSENLYAFLDVEFYGRVIVHDKGFRAEKQRVLAAHLHARCEFCPEEPAGLVIKNGYSAEAGPLAVRCKEHIGPFDAPLTLDALSKDLGCPVVFG